MLLPQLSPAPKAALLTAAEAAARTGDSIVLALESGSATGRSRFQSSASQWSPALSPSFTPAPTKPGPPTTTVQLALVSGMLCAAGLERGPWPTRAQG